MRIVFDVILYPLSCISYRQNGEGRPGKKTPAKREATSAGHPDPCIKSNSEAIPTESRILSEIRAHLPEPLSPTEQKGSRPYDGSSEKSREVGQNPMGIE
jgi:hypothetical protein